MRPAPQSVDCADVGTKMRERVRKATRSGAGGGALWRSTDAAEAEHQTEKVLMLQTSATEPRSSGQSRFQLPISICLWTYTGEKEG